MRVYARGNNGTREGFCMKTNPVTTSFYCFNIMLSLRANVKTKKLKKFYGRKFALYANCRFSKLTTNRLRTFFLNCCAIAFSDAKSHGLKKTWGHRVNFLVISDISEKSGLENPFGMLPW